MDPKYDRDESEIDKILDRLAKIDIRLVRIEERQLNRMAVAQIVKAEIVALQRDYANLSKLVWGISGASGAAVIGTLGWALSRVFKAP